MVEKWPIYFLPSLFGCLNGFLFSNQRTAGRRTLEGRASAEKRKAAGAAGSRLAGSVIRGPFHVTGAWSECAISPRGIRNFYRMRTGQEEDNQDFHIYFFLCTRLHLTELKLLNGIKQAPFEPGGSGVIQSRLNESPALKPNRTMGATWAARETNTPPPPPPPPPPAPPPPLPPQICYI